MNLVKSSASDWAEEREEYPSAITYPRYPVPKVKLAYNALRDIPKVDRDPDSRGRDSGDFRGLSGSDYIL